MSRAELAQLRARIARKVSRRINGHPHAVEDAAAAPRRDSKTGVVDASLAAILQEIAQRMERDRKQQREALAAILTELRLLRAAFRERRQRQHRRDRC
jgi:hypothetical protein